LKIELAKVMRSHEIAAWMSKVAVRNKTEASNNVAIYDQYRPNALSQKEFEAIKAKAETGDLVSEYQLACLYAWLVGGTTNGALAGC
jgi:hypothetical protein